MNSYRNEAILRRAGAVGWAAALVLCAVMGAALLVGCSGNSAGCPMGDPAHPAPTTLVGRGGTPIGEADQVKRTCGVDCECICLEFPESHAGRRCACGPAR